MRAASTMGGDELKSGMLSAIAAGLVACATPHVAFADPAPTLPPGVSTNAAPVAAASAAAATDPAVAAATAPDPGSITASASSAAGGGVDGAPAVPSVPSGTYPLAASAPLPSEAKKLAAETGGAEGGKDKKSGKESRAGRLEELNAVRLELDLKELEMREKTQELLRQEQTAAVLQEELELARRLNTILKTELDQANEKSKLSMGLCAQVGGVP